MLPHWNENDYSLESSRLHYYRTTPPGSGKPALVLAHGFSDDGLCWSAAARDLEGQFDIILPDARGHGLSERLVPDQPFDAAADLAGLIRGLNVAPVILGGHSMGAMTATQVGARFPELVRALVLEDPPWFLPSAESAPPSRPNQQNQFTDWVRSLPGQSMEEVVAHARAENPTWPEDAVRPWAIAKTRLDLNFFTAIRGGWGSWQELVEKFQCPVLLITADPDKGGLITPAVAEMVTAMNPRIRVAHIPGAGHHVRFMQYAAYMAALHPFLAEIG